MKPKVSILLGRLFLSIGRHLPRSSSKNKIGLLIRRAGAKLFLSEAGKNINIEKGARFSHRCTIGNNSGIGLNAQIGDAHIGNNVMMGPDCVIISSNHNFDRTDIPMNKQGVSETRPVFIGDDVWIGQRVIILPGIHIGNGAIIGAGSVVTHDVKDYCVVAGNPARVIKNRKEANMV